MRQDLGDDLGMRVTTNALQVMGGSGYMKDYPVEKMMRDAKSSRFTKARTRSRENVIGQALIKEAAKKK